MENKNIRSKPVYALVKSCFDAWIHNTRTILMLLVLAAATYITVYSYGMELKYSGVTMHLDESIVWFLMTGFNSISLSSLVFLVAISEIPRRIPFMQYSAFRSTKTKWAGSLICYCFLMVIIVVVLLTCLSALFLSQHVTAGSGWSETLRIQNGMPEEFAYIPAWIRENYTPWQAIVLSVVPIICFWLVMVLSILLFNLINHPMVGLSLFAIILFSGLIFVFENFPELQAPMSFSTLLRIVNQYEDTFHNRIRSVFIGYGIIILCQMAVIILVSRKADTPTFSSVNV